MPNPLELLRRIKDSIVPTETPELMAVIKEAQRSQLEEFYYPDSYVIIETVTRNKARLAACDIINSTKHLHRERYVTADENGVHFDNQLQYTIDANECTIR